MRYKQWYKDECINKKGNKGLVRMKKLPGRESNQRTKKQRKRMRGIAWTNFSGKGNIRKRETPLFFSSALPIGIAIKRRPGLIIFQDWSFLYHGFQVFLFGGADEDTRLWGVLPVGLVIASNHFRREILQLLTVT